MTILLLKRLLHRCKILKSTYFGEHLRMSPCGFWTRLSYRQSPKIHLKTIFDKVSSGRARKEICFLFVYLLFAFRRKNAPVILLETKKVCDWSAWLKMSYWYTKADMKCWAVFLSWKKRNRQLKKFHICQLFSHK